jgi:VanZ family protein
MSGTAERSRLPAMISAWGLVALWMAVIFSLSSDQFSDVNTAAWLSGMPIVRVFGLPPAVIEAGNFIVRKCMHFVEYAVLTMLTFRALRATRPGYSDRRLLAAAVLVAALCASMDELHQHLATLTRTGTPTDVVLDSFGALAGAVVAATYLYRRRPHGAA